jgi:hypothetical protein
VLGNVPQRSATEHVVTFAAPTEASKEAAVCVVELDCLEEIVQSFESGRYENPEYIKRQISDIESHHETLSREAKRLLYRARCAIERREDEQC